MVYLDIQDTHPVMYFPTGGRTLPADAEVELSVKNTIDGKVLTFTIDALEPAGFLLMLVCFPPEGLYTGEWQYFVDVNGERMATGLLVVYDGERPQSVEYNKAVNVIQYE